MSYASLMDNSLAYRVWQTPFAEKKLAPLYAHADPARARRVLDVGCGPGTNTAHFAAADYLAVAPKVVAVERRAGGARPKLSGAAA